MSRVRVGPAWGLGVGQVGYPAWGLPRITEGVRKAA